MAGENERKKLIGLIHQQKAKAKVCDICKKVFFSDKCPDCQAGGHRIRDEEYRSFLQLYAGKTSCSQMDEIELKMVATAFDDLGYRGYWKRRSEEHRRRQTQTIHIIKKEAARVLGEFWADRLDGFVDKVIKKDSLYELDDNELRQVIGWLRRLKKSSGQRDRF